MMSNMSTNEHEHEHEHEHEQQHQHELLVQQKKQQLSRSQMLEEQPKVDSALKSFASLLVATASTKLPQQQQQPPQPPNQPSDEAPYWNLMDCLHVTRQVSKHMNQHIVAIGQQRRCSSMSGGDDDPSPVVVAQQVWNELVAAQQKPTKMLGRTALQLIWDDLDLEKALLAQGPPPSWQQQSQYPHSRRGEDHNNNDSSW